ncbi:MAG: prepilin-type N-terminal cleavage/methylation domain-containing protein [Phycisphaerae bacterium]
MFHTHLTHRRAFTLVEILIVVIILGILAAIVIPQFANASTDARASNLKTTLNSVRNQIELFKGQHNDQPPQLTGMWTLLTTSSDTNETSVAAPTGTRWGPYIQSPPINPLNNQTAVSSAANDPNAGWYYQPSGIGFTFSARDAAGDVITTY